LGKTDVISQGGFSVLPRFGVAMDKHCAEFSKICCSFRTDEGWIPNLSMKGESPYLDKLNGTSQMMDKPVNGEKGGIGFKLDRRRVGNSCNLGPCYSKIIISTHCRLLLQEGFRPQSFLKPIIQSNAGEVPAQINCSEGLQCRSGYPN